MKIKKIQLDYAQKDGFSSDLTEGICHVKTLPYLSVVQAVEGNYDIQLGNGEMYNTGAGGFFVAPANVQQTIVHHIGKMKKNMVCRWVFLKVKINDLYYFDELYDFPIIISDDRKNSFNTLFNRLFSTDSAFDEYVCYYEIIRQLFLISKEKTKKVPSVMKDALAYIKKNYKEKITVEALANTVGLSSSHFFSVFKKTIGISPIAYLNSYRLSMAAELLLNSGMTVNEISDSVGVSDPVYFNKMFRKAYQMSPGRYRQTYKNGRN